MSRSDALKLKSKDELKNIAVRKGMVVGEAEKKESIIDRIVEVEMTIPPVGSKAAEQKTAVQAEKPKPVTHEQEAVIEYCKIYLVNGMRAEFPGDGTITFKGGAHETSVTLTAPLNTILSTAAYAAGF